MLVAEVRSYRTSTPLHTPFVTALRRTTTVDSLLVELVDSDGRSGWGKAPEVRQVTGESVAGAESCLAGPLAARVILEAAQLELARAHDIGTLVGAMIEGPVGVGAAASLVAAYGTSRVSDLDAAWWLTESPVHGGIRYAGATVVLPSAPGLGITGLADHQKA